MNMGFREVMPRSAEVKMPATMEMDVPPGVVVPEAVIEIMAAAGSVSVVITRMGEPDTAVTEMTTTGPVGMADAKRNPRSVDKMMPTARAVNVVARVIMPAPAIVVMAAVRPVDMAEMQIDVHVQFLCLSMMSTALSSVIPSHAIPSRPGFFD